MKDERCTECGEVIPLDACQHGQMFQGVWHPFHVGCADEYCSKEIEVWRVEFGNAWVEKDYAVVMDALKHMDVDDEYVISKKLMKQGDYMRLPEFQGF